MLFSVELCFFINVSKYLASVKREYIRSEQTPSCDIQTIATH